MSIQESEESVRHIDDLFSSQVKKCTKCKLPVKGQSGPCGIMCQNIVHSDSDAYVEEPMNPPIEAEPKSKDTSSPQDKTLETLVITMSELRTTLENISRGQEELCQMLKHGMPTTKQNTEMSAIHQQVPVIHSESVGPSQAENEVVTLHGGVKIPAKTKNAALRGEFINLAEFLLDSETPSLNELEPFMNNGNVTFRQKKTRKVIDSFSRWLNAWSNYERLLVSNMPELYLCMLEYRQFLQSCDLKYQWSAVHAYDCRFRAKLGETCSFQLNSVQNDLFVIIFDATAVKRNIRACHRCKSLDHLANNCPVPLSNTLEEKKTPAKSKGERFFHQGVEICNNYQSGRCGFPSCRRAHVCQKCRGPDSFERCTNCQGGATGGTASGIP